MFTGSIPDIAFLFFCLNKLIFIGENVVFCSFFGCYKQFYRPKTFAMFWSCTGYKITGTFTLFLHFLYMQINKALKSCLFVHLSARSFSSPSKRAGLNYEGWFPWIHGFRNCPKIHPFRFVISTSDPLVLLLWV